MKKLNDLELEGELLRCVRRERLAAAEVLRYLREVEERQLHLVRGYSSLFAYCTGKLGYSEPEAQLRIQAMRLVRVVPETEALVEQGQMSLSVAGEIAGAMRREKLEAEETQELVRELTGASKREAERALATRFPAAPRVERVKAVSEELVEIRFTVTREEAALLEALLDRTAHANYERSYRKLFLDLARKALKKAAALPQSPGSVRSGSHSSPAEKRPAPPSSGKPAVSQTRPPRPPRIPLSPGLVNSRHIPAQARREVWQRDQARCQYQDPLTKQRCNSKHGLHLDHIQPFAQGGAHRPQNLRLLCGPHNRLRNKKPGLLTPAGPL